MEKYQQPSWLPKPHNGTLLRKGKGRRNSRENLVLTIFPPWDFNS